MNHNANEKNIKAVGLLGAVGGIGDDLIAEAADDSTALHAGRTRTWSRLCLPPQRALCLRSVSLR